MADLLTAIRRDIDTRLAELRPVLDEVRRLERALDALSTSTGRGKRPPGRGARRTAKQGRMTKARSQEIDGRVLALLSADPRQKPAALALLTETSVASMNSRLSRLVGQGMLKKRKRGNSVRYEVPKAPAAHAR